MRDHSKVKVTEDGFSLHFCQLRPESRGRIGLHSADAFADPKIEANYLATPEDRRVMRESVRIGRRVVGQAALSPYRDTELAPGEDVSTDGQIDAWVRATAETIYHPVGTCKMGADGDTRAVVDGALRVRGIGGAARDRCIGDAVAGQLEHQRPDDHDRGKGGGPDPGGKTGAGGGLRQKCPASKLWIFGHTKMHIEQQIFTSWQPSRSISP